MPDIIFGKIDGYNHEGMGIMRLGNQTVFIPGALDGENVKVRLTERKKSSVAWAGLLEVADSSPHRQATICPHADRCGGCQLQHATYSHQLDIKQAILQRAMATLRRQDEAVLSKIDPILSARDPVGYRNKGVFAIGQLNDVRSGSDSTVAIGFYGRQSRDIAGHGCPVLFSRQVNALLDDLSLWFGKEVSVAGSKNPEPDSVLHHLLIRESKTTGEIVLILACEKLPCWIPSFVSAFTAENADRTYVLSGIGWLSSNKNQTVISGKPTALWGSLDIIEELYFDTPPEWQNSSVATPLSIRVSPEAFFQINTAQANVLCNEALKICSLSGKEILWGLYCGSGIISLFLASHAKAVIGIDINEASIRDAWTNAHALPNAQANSYANTHANANANVNVQMDIGDKTQASIRANAYVNTGNQPLSSVSGSTYTVPLYKRLCFLAGPAEKLAPSIIGEPGFLTHTLKSQQKLYVDSNGAPCRPPTELIRLLSGKSPDAIVLDPPTKGADPAVLKAILTVAPSRVLYISCDPATLARDLQILMSSEAYRLIRIQPLDMFPQTAHVETLVFLQRQH